MLFNISELLDVLNCSFFCCRLRLQPNILTFQCCSSLLAYVETGGMKTSKSMDYLDLKYTENINVAVDLHTRTNLRPQQVTLRHARSIFHRLVATFENICRHQIRIAPVKPRR